MRKFVQVDRDTAYLLPPDLRDWVAPDHLVHFVIEAVALLDLSQAQVNERGTGSAQYPPAMLLGLLLYSYATGVFSSRQMERSTHENLAVRYLCANTHPDHDTLCRFRVRHQSLIEHAFVRLLEMAQQCGLFKVGQLTVAVDGTKVLAHASKHHAVSYAGAQKRLEQLESEVAELMQKAQQADSTPLQDGLSLPAEIVRRQELKAKLEQARREIEARHRAKQLAQAREAGEPPAEGPLEGPPGKMQVNFTDADSRIMPGKDGFVQAYNAQAAVETETMLIVGARICQNPNDQQELTATVAAVQVVEPQVVLCDKGFLSEKQVQAVEQPGAGKEGPTVYAATGRQGHGRTVAQLEKREDPPAPGPQASFMERMRHRVSTQAGRALYALRQQTVEPVFGIIKQTLGWRRFSLRGRRKAALEWTLVSLAYNVKRLHRLVGVGKLCSA